MGQTQVSRLEAKLLPLFNTVHSARFELGQIPAIEFQNRPFIY